MVHQDHQICLTHLTTSDYLELVNLMGLIFQIRDDYMNLQSDQVTCSCGLLMYVQEEQANRL